MVQLDYNGTTYIFDPQVEDVIAGGRGGSIMYIRFGGTAAQLADKYRYEKIMDDFPQSKKGGGESIIGWDSEMSVTDFLNKWNSIEDSRDQMDILWASY